MKELGYEYRYESVTDMEVWKKEEYDCYFELYINIYEQSYQYVCTKKSNNNNFNCNISLELHQAIHKRFIILGFLSCAN